MDQLRFTLWEMLSLLGVAQCIYIMVYILFRVTNFRQAILPILYFLTLGSAFFLDFGRNTISEFIPSYELIIWAAWSYVIPLSVLLIIQIAQLSKLPRWPLWGVLLFIPIAFLTSYYFARDPLGNACGLYGQCETIEDWTHITGLIAGALSLLVIWGQRNLLEDLHAQKAGQERYWLILALIMVNIGFLLLIALEIGGFEFNKKEGLARTILGLAFIYLTTTSLFRIYPQALILLNPKKREEGLTPEEEVLAQRIQDLLTLDKVYHEPTYSRADLARELQASEASISKVINVYFKKSLPQLLNEQRIADAKRLLLDTNVNIKIVAQEVGFNSIPSFNRVFKELEGRSPSEYRKAMIK